MVNQRNDKGGFFGTVILIVLFVLFVSASEKSANKPVGKAIQHAASSGLQENAAAQNDAQLFFWPKNSMYPTYRTRYSLFSENRRIMSENRLTDQKLLFLHMTELLIKPLTLHWFYNQYHDPDCEIPPVLS
jgi:hypothetical protein